jgi:putative transposase
MARKQRLHFPGSTYHCMLRGNNGKNIFKNENDFSRLSLLIQEGVERYDHRILGFCFMSNHIHLVIQVAETPLSKIVQNFAFRYARFINRNYKQIGHLFQGRFKAVLVSDSKYLLELIRYVHLNPVRAGITKTPEEYFWTGHHMYMNKDTFQWVSTLRILRRFHHTRSLAKQKYEAYIHKGIGKECTIDFESGNQTGLDVLGDDSFTENLILTHALEDRPRHSTNTLLQTSLNYFDIDLCTLSSKNRNHNSSKIRSIIAYLTRELEGCSLTELTKSLGRDISTLSNSANRIEKLMTQDKELKNIIQAIKEKLSKKTSFKSKKA